MIFVDWLKQVLGCREEELLEEVKTLNERIKDLKGMIDSGDTIDAPIPLDIIKIADLRSLLSLYCGNIYLSDTIYGLTSMEEAKKFSIETKIAARQWIKEQHDCDEFSFALMGYWNVGLKQFAFGIAWSNSHAFNIMVDEKKQIWIIEPQTNKFIKIEEAGSPYIPLRVVMI